MKIHNACIKLHKTLSGYFSEAVYTGFFLPSLCEIPIGVLIQID